MGRRHKMDGNGPDQASRWGAPAGLIAAIAIGLMATPGILVRHYIHGDLNAFHFLFILFFSTNILICYWEVCLFFRRDYIEERAEYWRRRRIATGRTPAVEFLTGKVPLTRTLSPTVWADVWATYSMYDSAYANRLTYGFNVDIANGFVTVAPTLFLYVSFTTDLLPAKAVGVIGALLFWQWIYMTSVYFLSFFVGQKRRRITGKEMCVYILGPNAVWVLVPILGLYLSMRLVFDGSYGVLGIG